MLPGVTLQVTGALAPELVDHGQIEAADPSRVSPRDRSSSRGQRQRSSRYSQVSRVTYCHQPFR